MPPLLREMNDVLLDGQGEVETTVEWNVPSGHAGCLDEMVTSLVNGQQPMTRSADNAKSVGMVLAAIESARTGQRVPVPL